MIVVADTSPLNYLIQIDETDILPKLFGRVIIPEAVRDELLDPLSRAKVRGWMERPPDWLEIDEVKRVAAWPDVGLGRGERDAMRLALDLGIGLVLMDERKGRRVARELALQVEGTLGILERASTLGMTDFREAVRRLEATNFRWSSALRAAFLGRIM